MHNISTREERQTILNSISKHPNSKFAKLFHENDASPSEKNIVLLLIELTQQKDFYVDFNISLKYFLQLYEKLDAVNKEFLFNETGLLIYNAVQVYSRRVDCVLERVEYQLAELSNTQENKEKKPTDDDDDPASENVEKPKRKKRLVEACDPYEVEMFSKKFRKLTPAKRFTLGTKIDASKLYSPNIHAETYTHPALWKHAEIIDLDNNDEFDSKRNYRLFTYHLEHRYNTLVPDINFRLYYKMKDFMDEEDERDGESEFCDHSDWPPLSQAYVKRYIDLEDQVLAKDKIFVKKFSKDGKRKLSTSSINNTDNGEYAKISHQSDSGIGSSFFEKTINDCPNESNLKQNSQSSQESQADSGMGASFLQLSNSDGEELSSLIECGNDVNISTHDAKQKGNEEPKIELTESSDLEKQFESISSKTNTEEKEKEQTESEKMNMVEGNIDEMVTNAEDDAHRTEGIENSESSENVNTTDGEIIKDKQFDETGKGDAQETIEATIRIESDKNQDCVSNGSCAPLSPTNDEGVCLSDIDDTSSIQFTIHLSTTTTFQLDEKSGKEMYALPLEKEPIEWPIVINILEFPANILKKMRKKRLLTNLGDEMELFLKSRSFKRTRNTADENTSKPRRIKLMNLYDDDSPSNLYCLSPQSETDFLGFAETDDDDFFKSNTTNLRLSRDSGVENDLLISSPEKNPMFCASIEEESNENDAIAGNICAQNDSKNIEILSNVLLSPWNEVSLPLAIVESFDTQIPEAFNMKIEETNEEEITKETGEQQHNDDQQNLKFPSVSEESNIELSNHKEQNFELSGHSAEKIQRWHKHLQPILAKARERHHFDVFEIGTNIINEFEEKESNSKSITFQNVMEHQDPSYVSRYFLSTLLLANQGNIELNVSNKSDNNPSEWHDLHLKLISTTRHVVSMEDNIGLVPSATVSTTVSNVKVQTSKAKKRSVSTLIDNVNLDLDRIEIVKPIGKPGKILRTSVGNDSGIFSNDDMENL